MKKKKQKKKKKERKKEKREESVFGSRRAYRSAEHSYRYSSFLTRRPLRFRELLYLTPASQHILLAVTSFCT